MNPASHGAVLPDEDYPYGPAEPVIAGLPAHEIDAQAPWMFLAVLLAISVAAVALAFARLVPTDVGSPQQLVEMWVFFTGCSAAIGLLGALPAGACLLWPLHLGHGLFWFALHTALVVTAVWCLVISVCLWHKSTVPFDDLACTTIVIVSFFGTLALAALAARGFGYRLILGKASRQPRAISSGLEGPPAA
jgi:hypothetical protein